MNDQARGIYRKYNVRRLGDETGKHERCSYFVLDLVHDKFSVPALRAYAKACKKEHPQLAKDIRWALSTGVSGIAIQIKMERA
jgi:phage terminase large subunit-like protein